MLKGEYIKEVEELDDYSRCESCTKYTQVSIYEHVKLGSIDVSYLEFILCSECYQDELKRICR